jgi:glycosyltransferase involved in cell wall biosynthesis
MSENPTISIITVVFNDRVHIESTILSVLGQTYPGIEYVIVDGGSDDGTLDVIRQYQGNMMVISEPDHGLYDAMNKGLRAAKGDYVWFLNSGDRVFSENTVERMVSGMPGRPDMIYGGTMIIDAAGKEIGDRRLKPPADLTWKSFRRGMIVCHQSLVVRKDIAEEFNPDYRISADIDWAIRCAKRSGSIHYAGMVLSRFLEGGLSRRNIMLSLKERFRIMTIHFGFLPTLLRHFLFAVRLSRFYIWHRRI